ncbi:hypothetical protein M378DRAFT_12938 [Amanita muscaria Koide BX008]|uniref:Uncharacterized protein n=1 Tax=Amanita muscaria (strain Koide BX008) TaxID=946122 RepID=A0A0C2T6K0_AMAMK|nr:hypothetical protein M378DRAFT_12938 [Amanita muscaria Koide BX008]
MCSTQPKKDNKSLGVALVEKEPSHILLSPKPLLPKKEELFPLELFHDMSSRFALSICHHAQTHPLELLMKKFALQDQGEHRSRPNACDQLPMRLSIERRLPTTTERPQHSRRVSTVPPTAGPSGQPRPTGPPPRGRRSRGARTRGQNYQRARPIRSLRGTRPHPLDGFYDADHYTEGYDDHVDD